MLLDYAILKAIDTLNNGVWKKRIHEHILEHRDWYAIDSVSLQTVGRHVSDLRDADVVTACIIAPDSLNRDFIIGFKVTEQGYERLAELRDQILKEHVFREDSLVEPDALPALPKRALITLLGDGCGLEEKTREQMDERLDMTEVLVLLNLTRFASDYLDRVDRESIRRVVDTMMGEPALRGSILSDGFARLAQESLQQATQHGLLDDQAFADVDFGKMLAAQ